MAGCHTLNAGAEDCATCEEGVLETIGEVCVDFTDPETGEKHNWLVETNPDEGVCHAHAGGKGHPDVFDCDAYCKGSTEPESGEPYAFGSCEAVADFDCEGTVTASAGCVCAF